ncbi:carboxypeptidase regulatory-like domain-containing protein [bacterium]|nr:carboxypeptidase regulatory-like domain-containing protein [candidate division CSSED10-310 bacterium]
MRKVLMGLVIGLMIAGFSAIGFAGEEFGILSGTVVNLDTGEPVEGALVFVRICNDEPLMGSGSGPHGTHLYSDTTDEYGEFYIEDVPAGEWTAIARKRMAGRDEELVLIEDGVETIVTFELEATGSGDPLQFQLRHQGGDE